jgi:restriction system protein
MKRLTLSSLKKAARDFAAKLSVTPIPELFGVTDGKAVGTYVEQRFHQALSSVFSYALGSSASGTDFPELGVDVKVTSIKQPQSSCPFRDASQKVYGLGYHLLVFVYEKVDDPQARVAQLKIRQAVFVSSERTGDYQTTRGLLEVLERDGNKDDVIAFLEDRNLPLDDVGRNLLAERILIEQPLIGYLTVSNALQWRLQYGRALSTASSGGVTGVEEIYG